MGASRTHESPHSESENCHSEHSEQHDFMFVLAPPVSHVPHGDVEGPRKVPFTQWVASQARHMRACGLCPLSTPALVLGVDMT